MKDTIRYFRRQFIEAKDIAKMQWKSFTVAVLLVGFFYAMSTMFDPGWITYALIFPPALVVAVTALPRVNDIGPEHIGTRWEVRKIALIMVGAGAVMTLGAPFAEHPLFPSWRTVILMYGFAGAWMTTPGMPPWDYYVTGAYRFLSHPPDYVPSPLERVMSRITGQLSTEELLRAQTRWEEEQKAKANRNNVAGRRGDGVDP